MAADRCHNCDAPLPEVNQFDDWESICHACGNLTWLATGDDVQCTVGTLTRFGIIVELGDRVRGLVHISELTDARVEHPAEVVTEGDLVTATVLSIDLVNRKVSLSLSRVRG